MKKHFITGLIILLPLAVTILVALFVFNLLTEPLAGALAKMLAYYDLLGGGPQIQYFVSQILVLGFLLLFTILLGMIARYFFVNYMINLWDFAMHKIPLIRSIYKASQDVIKTLFTSSNNSFKQVVLIPFPYPGSYSIGFITQEEADIAKNGEKESKIAVFMPTAPNPTSGFLMLFDKKDVIYIDMKVEDAFKYVVSCGVIPTPFISLPPP
jgi:uncharacterized membrane protein